MIQNPTRHTIDRAKHHLSEMKNSFQDDEVFSFSFSSFVESARSITLHMQKQYDKKEGFRKWYEIKVIEMKEKPELRFLINARNYSEKEGPIPTGATREISLGLRALINPAKEGSKPEVPVSEITKASPTIEPPKPTTVSRWFWNVISYLDKGDKVYAPEFERNDVIETCEIILEYLDKLVNDCEKRFS